MDINESITALTEQAIKAQYSELSSMSVAAVCAAHYKYWNGDFAELCELRGKNLHVEIHTVLTKAGVNTSVETLRKTLSRLARGGGRSS